MLRHRCRCLEQLRDEVGVDRGSRGGVVFANGAAELVRHEEVGARQRESDGVVQAFKAI